MKHNNTRVSSKRNWSQNSEPLGTTNLTQRERVRHSKLAGITIPLVMLFVLTLFPEAIINKNPALIAALSLGLGVCIVAFFLNWRGFVKIAGILTLMGVYTVGTFIMLHYPQGLKASDLYLLGLTIIPDLLAVAFFSANSLLLVACINALQVGAILMFGPHDSTLTNLLQTAPIETVSHVYILQLITAAVLYLWARSTEHALAHADQSKEAEIFGKHAKEWQQKELEKKRQLDDGIQQILQTHVAVANGDLNARAPLLRDHELWQVASALNNLIARHQSLSHVERKLRKQLWEGNQRTTDQFPKYEQVTGQFPRYEQTTGQFPKYEQTTGQFPKYEQTTGQFPKYEGNGSSSNEAPPKSPRHTRSLFHPN